MKHILAGVLIIFPGLGCQAPPETAIDLGENEPALTQVTHGRSGEDKDPEVSRDGKLLFYASSSYGENLDLYVKKIGTNTVTRLTTAPGDERFPKINPRNKNMLAFCSNNRGEWDIYVMEDCVNHPAQIGLVSEPGVQDIHPSWSPDGQSLVYCSTDDLGGGTWVVKVKDLVTGKIRTLEDVDGLLPEWSPTGDRIVIQRMRHRDEWYGSIWSFEFEGDTARPLTSVFAGEDWAAINPSWSPDGRRIVFATVAKSRPRAAVLHEADDIWTVNADGSHATRLTTNPAADGMPTWSVDPESAAGRIFFVSKRTGTNRIWSLAPQLPDQAASPEKTAPPTESGEKTAFRFPSSEK